MTASPLISIIIPTLQEGKVIGPTLQRLKSEFHLPHEIIVSDGGSLDDTVATASHYADQVIAFHGPGRQTIAQGRNAGARAARGYFLVFLDADCVIREPDRFFEKALSDFSQDKTLAGLTGSLRVLPELETRADKAMFGIMNLNARMRNNIFRRGDAVGGEFQMVRHDAFDAIGGYREDLVTREDRDLFMRLSKKGRILFDNTLVVYHTGRRAHAMGWPKLIGLFIANTLSFHLRGKVRSKEWTPIR